MGYRREDIVLHEYAHGFHLLGAKYGIDGFQARLTHLYQSARQRGLWATTYAQTNEAEYFVSSYKKCLYICKDRARKL